MVKLWPELSPNVRSRLSLTARKMASGGMCRRSPLVLSLAGFRIAIELPQTKGHVYGHEGDDACCRTDVCGDFRYLGRNADRPKRYGLELRRPARQMVKGALFRDDTSFLSSRV